MKNTANRLLLTLGFGAMMVASVATASAEIRVSFGYHSAPADVRVWLDRVDSYEHTYGHHGYDVYRSLDDIVLSVRASRDTYAAVYVVDTEGFVHVLHPCEPGESAFLYGGQIYEFHLSELGFAPWQFERGVAFAYAVTSPAPFSFAAYDVNVFGPRWGIRVSGDPYVASRRFYASLLPGSCDAGLISVSYARFYVREYVRYPSYLCAGWHDDHGVRMYCRGDCSVYRSYRAHASDPYRILNPKYRFKNDVDHYTNIETVHYEPQREVRPRADRKVARTQTGDVRKVISERNVRTISAKANADRGVPSKPIIQEPTSYAKTHTQLTKQQPVPEQAVVRSSKGQYVRGMKNIETKRDELRQRAAAQKVSSKSVTAKRSSRGDSKEVRVAAEEENESKRTQAKSKSSSDKSKGAR